MKVKLTQKYIDNPPPVPSRKAKQEHCDIALPGLVFEQRAVNSEWGTFRLRYKDSCGKTSYAPVGRSCDISLARAREKCRQLKAQLLLNPQAELRQTGKGVTWSELFQDYLVYKRSHEKRSLKYDMEMHRLRIEPRFGDTPISKLTPVQIREFHADIKNSGLSPATADHHLKLIRHALNLAVDWDLLKSNPALKVKQFNQTRIINRALDPEELARLMKVLTTDNNRMVCHFIMLLLALGTRKGELLLAEWKHVDRAKRALLLPGGNAKSGRDRYVFLSDFALDVLDKLGTEGKHTHLFVSSRTGKRLTTVSKTWERLRKKAQLEDCRIHDLRRTHGTILGEANVNAMLIKDALGHASVTMSQIYVAPHDTARLQAANIAGDHLSSALKSAADK